MDDFTITGENRPEFSFYQSLFKYFVLGHMETYDAASWTVGLSISLQTRGMTCLFAWETFVEVIRSLFTDIFLYL